MPDVTAELEESGMDKIYVVYWSGTGNTEAMAGFVAAGIQSAGKEAEVVDVASADISQLKAAKAFAMGCPSMGAEVLEEEEMEPFVTDLEKDINGKQIGLFGSYGWGNGEWMKDWEERMKNAGAVIVGGEGIIAMDAPDDDAANALKQLGKELAAL